MEVEQAQTLLLELTLASRNLRTRALGTELLSDATVYLLATMTGAAALDAVLRPRRIIRPRP
ncbi:hypothetical protein [Nannocystis bainbridge]|uniref:MarR family transcriptional regulator n=1 Tax=Nannocystis bainbridge TaxID=2995303 RepID=A0ABT5E7E6_9BACT|nr:hypothetical protein [Nannocystis bainbridge]MDC0721791.1 hypothetical protein [Nannocystis bainbridge]